MWTVSVLGQSPRELHEGLAFAGGVSPDGTRIAFTPQAGTSGDVREIWVMDTQGDNPQKVLAVAENEVFNGVRWSPDGQRLAYIKEQWTSEGYRGSIETCSVKGEKRTAIVSNSRQLLSIFAGFRTGEWCTRGRRRNLYATARITTTFGRSTSMVTRARPSINRDESPS